MITTRLSACLFASLFAVAAGAATPVSGRIADLAWMTGDWAGPVGPGQTLEEHWIAPTGGSIAALVRNTGNGATSMVELIVVEQQGDSLVLRVQQWDPGYRPRTPAAQEMVLIDLGERRVSFHATAKDSGLQTLTYSRPADDAFNIDIETVDGQSFQIKLMAQ